MSCPVFGERDSHDVAPCLSIDPLYLSTVRVVIIDSGGFKRPARYAVRDRQKVSFSCSSLTPLKGLVRAIANPDGADRVDVIKAGGRGTRLATHPGEAAMSGKTLSGQDAFDLYQKGKQKWNNWVDQNPDAVIDFSNFDFKGRIPDGQTISFERFIFPNGGVHFDGAEFGDGHVRFDRALFGDGHVRFDRALFGDGYIGFDRAQFGKGYVGFDYAEFGDGHVSFDYAEFGKGNVSFDYAEFGKGNVDFSNAQFGDGVSFGNAQFGKGNVSFDYAEFGKGNVDFSNAQFGDGVSFGNAQFGDGDVIFQCAYFGDGGVIFQCAHFGDGNVRFDYAHFGDGNAGFDGAHFGDGLVDFNGAHFGNGKFSFGKTKFDGSLYFGAPKNTKDEANQNTKDISLLSFNGAIFKQNFVLEGHFHCIPDLRYTKIEHHFDLSGVKIDKLTRNKDKDKDKAEAKENAEENAARLRRLRELAENNRHHDAGLDFFALESRVMRKSGDWCKFRSALDRLYQLSSNYGRSILRPSLWLLLSTLSFFVIYWWSATAQCAKWQDALNLAVSNALPFILSSRGQAEVAFKALFPEKTVCLVLLTYGQSLLSLVFIFLIGLGLRNRFRL